MRQIPNIRFLSSLPLIFGSLYLGVGCSPWVGNTIEIREIPAVSGVPETLRGSGKVIAIGSVSDERTLPATDGPADPYSEATGDVAQVFADSLKSEFEKRGFAVAPGAPFQLNARLVKWRTKVEAKTSARVESEASLALNVLDRTNRTVYSSSYNGARESDGPMVSKNDIRNSLQAAAANTVAQIVQDEKLLRIITAQ